MSGVYWPLQTIMCAKLVRVSQEENTLAREQKYQAKYPINLSSVRVDAKILFDLI